MKKRLVIAPDSFKGCMTAMEAAKAIEAGWRSVMGDTWSYDKVPMADGGEGTTQSLHDALNGVWRTIKVTGPLGEAVHASYSIAFEGTTAIIEMAAASGLDLLAPETLNPLMATTFGTGEMIKDALDQGATKIILGIGGSATNDGGAGLLQALGVALLDAKGKPIERGGAALQHLAHIDMTKMDARLMDVTFEVACDVTNPLLGKMGATAVYGAQKGVTDETFPILEHALTQYHNVIKQDLHKDVADIPGAGAAGGLGTGLLACLPVSLRSGVEIVLEVTNFRHYALNADLVITGEGRIDGQTAFGKTPVGVAQAAKKYHKPVIAVAGSIGEGYEAVFKHGIDAVYSLLSRPCSLDIALAEGPVSLKRWAENMARFYQIAERH
ncbi:glycerate kinase [Staphylococcus muscae]|uniref:Glycerate kinase n=1 Tax=Staphylococcus muscae TaxID=1294 RepID=A0A240C8K0_9STAP|nr:glycerate kinase [Staphylococcus muscae]AVQ33800.1 glycerate kinase [Staphylococcus muscae]PNZ06307.1 glycerate kinase [Staphylococcus muscae]GGA87824.1 glycerate kinase [Staphylococcus muscae]SNW04307.1 glycerate kinase [Staphylococcus muscae]